MLLVECDILLLKCGILQPVNRRFVIKVIILLFWFVWLEVFANISSIHQHLLIRFTYIRNKITPTVCPFDVLLKCHMLLLECDILLLKCGILISNNRGVDDGLTEELQHVNRSFVII